MTADVDAAKAKLLEWKESFIVEEREEMIGLVSEEQIEQFLSNSPYLRTIAGLEAVLKLHRPFAYTSPEDFIAGNGNLTYLPWCQECSPAANEEDGVDYPCPTVSVVLKALGVGEA